MEENAVEKRLQEKLLKRKGENTYRSMLIPAGGELDFSSNDYLGLGRNPDLAQLIKLAYEKLPVSNGSGGSRLLSGNSVLAEALERQMAHFFQASATLLFNSGYVANQALLSSIPQRGDTILYDELSHACIKEGVRLCLANKFSFRHNDPGHLEQRLSQAKGQVFVVVESVYSMDGDAAPLQEICRLCHQYKAALIVDEAHSTGIYGKGSGLVCALGLQQQVFARVHTFGKGIGSHGACVAGSEALRNYLINFARPFIYTTALPQHSLLSLQETFSYLHQHPELIQQLQEKVGLFNTLKKQYLEELLPSDSQIYSESPVQAIIYPGAARVRELACTLKKAGYDIRPILAPTVPAGKERLRICLHVYNTRHDIEGLINSLTKALK